MTNLGKYQLIEQLGEGGFGMVYKAQNAIGLTVALKVLKPQWAGDSEVIMRFRREALAAGSLFHQHIATITDMDEAEGRLFLVMRYVDGPSLDQIIKTEGPLTTTETLRLASQIGKALDFAVRKGFLHRDVKPNNILRDNEQTYFLTDFGLAKAMMSTGLSSHTGAVLGTPPYIAPEVWRGKQATPATDVYSLACVIYEALIGETLFTGDSAPAIMTAHVLDEPQLDKLPEAWQPVLRKALSKNPEDRYPNNASLVAELEVALRTETERKERGSIEKPRIPGDQWADYVLARKNLNQEQCKNLAMNVCSLLANQEENCPAHCGISGENLILQWAPEEDTYKVEFIDGAVPSAPDGLPASSAGYLPDWIKTSGIGPEKAGRFVAGLLLTEIIGWQSQNVRENRYKRTYFDPKEVGKECKRFDVLHDEIKTINQKVALLFAKTWFSTHINECPSLQEWQDALSEEGEEQPFDPQIEADQCHNTKTYSEMASNGEFLKQVTQNRQAAWEKSLASERIQYTNTQVAAIIQVWMKEMGMEVVEDWLTCECGQKQKNDEVYCQQCGKQMLPDRICPHCKSSTPANSTRCRNCGKKIRGFY